MPQNQSQDLRVLLDSRPCVWTIVRHSHVSGVLHGKDRLQHIRTPGGVTFENVNEIEACFPEPGGYSLN